MKYLYLDCSAGISPEAVVSAFLEIGADERAVTEAVRSLPIPGMEFSVRRETEGPFYTVWTDWQGDAGICTEDDWKGWILEVNLSPEGRAAARKILERYWNGKKWKPGLPVGLSDMVRMAAYAVALAACLENLGVWKVIIPWLGEGSGFSPDERGVGTIPGPEILRILEGTQVSLRTMPINRELITPEGAAMAATIQTADRLPDQYRIIRYGTGHFQDCRTGCVAASLIEDGGMEQGIVYRLETNMDDVTGEALGYVMDRLLQAGAGDVHYHSVYMKKNRPAYQLNVICTEPLVPVMERIIFQETTTLGIRRVPMLASRLKRVPITWNSSLGPVRGKQCEIPSEDGTWEERIYPEYTSIMELCRKYGKSFQEIYQIIMAELQKPIERIKGSLNTTR